MSGLQIPDRETTRAGMPFHLGIGDRIDSMIQSRAENLQPNGFYVLK